MISRISWCALLAFISFAGGPADAASRNWPTAGGDRQNTRNQQATRISAANVAHLAVAWELELTGNISATPAVQGRFLYITDWGNLPAEGDAPGGSLWKIDAKNGDVVWSRKIEDYTGIPADFARGTPTITGNKLIISNQALRLVSGPDPDVHGYLMAVDKDTGELVWRIVVDPHPAAGVTQSPAVLGNHVFVGTTSIEELFSFDPTYPCCTFRSRVLAIEASNGRVIWETPMVPLGYTGAAIWGSTPVVDPKRGLVYVATGNNYSVPAEVQACIAAATTEEEVRGCVDPDDHFDSVVALDRRTGVIRWVHSPMTYDAWTGGCAIAPDHPNCPAIPGPDYDFGQGPILLRTNDHGQKRELLSAGQKSGDYWALDPETGRVVWHEVVGPGGAFGGMVWEAATDAERIYMAVANSDGVPFELVDGTTIDQGFWSAIDAATGEPVWQQPVPPGSFSPVFSGRPTAQGPITVAGDVVFAGSLAIGPDDPTMFALDAATGHILWQFASGGSVNSGPAVVGNWVYWGSGYTFLDFGVANNKLYAFEIQ
jgi:polyvinyl alcohol dehydrogenase (cytochrome)